LTEKRENSFAKRGGRNAVANASVADYLLLLLVLF